MGKTALFLLLTFLFVPAVQGEEDQCTDTVECGCDPMSDPSCGSGYCDPNIDPTCGGQICDPLTNEAECTGFDVETAASVCDTTAERIAFYGCYHTCRNTMEGDARGCRWYRLVGMYGDCLFNVKSEFFWCGRDCQARCIP